MLLARSVSGLADSLRELTDGVVSTVSLLLGVHAERKGSGSAADAHEHLKAVALTGVAGLLAGAASMACGEWCVASQPPTMRAANMPMSGRTACIA